MDSFFVLGVVYLVAVTIGVVWLLATRPRPVIHRRRVHRRPTAVHRQRCHERGIHSYHP